MHGPWLGPRRVAFVPAIRPVDAAVPDDLVAQVERRVFYQADAARLREIRRLMTELKCARVF